eukprot:TRINITY_DN583_c0_g1_i1.p2 TRINITY_DN583_c0_g1~~TRINITY_DN583_c0_g1_i1.p2  ORF type:complete len:124 (+),score=45.71 TRINITY_DN583_c0_g1_i1:83-454(+)
MSQDYLNKLIEKEKDINGGLIINRETGEYVENGTNLTSDEITGIIAKFKDSSATPEITIGSVKMSNYNWNDFSFGHYGKNDDSTLGFACRSKNNWDILVIVDPRVIAPYFVVSLLESCIEDLE